MVCMVRTCLFLIDDALRFEHVRNILAVMPPLCLPSRCRNVSVGRLLVWPDFALLESLLVSTRPAPCSPLTPSDRSRSSAPEPEISCRASSGRAREAVPSRRTQLPPVNTRSSQRHQLGTLRCRDGSSRLFSAWNYFSPRTPGFPIVRCDNLVKTWQRFARWQKNCSNIYFSSNFQSWPSSKNHFTYFGDDYRIWNIFFCQVWLKVREMHRSFNLYWRATVLQYTQLDEITFRRKNHCRSRWLFCWNIYQYGRKGKSVCIDFHKSCYQCCLVSNCKKCSVHIPTINLTPQVGLTLSGLNRSQIMQLSLSKIMQLSLS